MHKILGSLLLIAQSLAWAQGVHPITGRRYAGVMGPGGADWLVRPERESEEHPDQALDDIGIAKGSVAADVGAGAGYITWRLAARVGPAGKVYANDIEPKMLDLLRRNMAERHITNVETVLGTVDDPKLPRAAVDVILLVDVYHEFSEPQKMLRHMRESLKPGGRLVLLEYRGEDPSVPIRLEHKMTVAQVKAELEPEGFRLDKTLETLPRQHILIFRPELSTPHAEADPLEGQWQGYDGEWGHVSRQLSALAEAIPAEKFAWRPAPGVRSTSEVLMHIAIANFYLLSVTGPKMPADLTSADMEKTVTAKADVIGWLKRSLEAVGKAHAGIQPPDLQRKVRIEGRDATVDGMYLRIIVHANEHMGQLVAYARMNAIVPPWSEGAK